MKMYLLSTLVPILLIFSTSLDAQNTTVLPAVKDNSIFSESGTQALGMGHLFTGQNCQGNIRRALVEFDLSGMPNNITITDVELSLGTENSGNNSDGIIEIYSITKEWGEGTSMGSGSGGPATASDATWTNAMFGIAFWDSPGGDFDPALLSSRFTTENFDTITFPSSANFVAQAQSWLGDPSLNHGIMIRGVEDQSCAAYRFGSKDIGVVPELAITWDWTCEPSMTNLSIIACESYTSDAGFTYTDSGIYTEILDGVDCDSIVDIDLTIFRNFETEIVNSLCEGATFTLGGTVFDVNNPSGTVVFQTPQGCDSIYNVDLTFLPTHNEFITETLCFGESILVNGTIYDQINPVGCETLVSENGCDSIICVDLTFFPQSMSTETYVGCEGDGYTVVVNGTTYSELNPNGVELLAAIDVNGCDSIVIVDLVFNSTGTSEVSFGTCDVSTPPFFTEIIASGAFNGCDSVINFSTVYYPTDEIFLSATTCNPNDAGTEIFTLTNTNGCDSIITFTTVFLPADSTFIFGSSCNPDDAGTFVEILSNIGGCDSVITTIIDLLPSDEEEILTTTCNPDDVGTEIITLANTNGCDSIITITTEFLPIDSTEIFTTSCDPDDAGVVVTTLISSIGCDSVVTTTTTFEPLDNSVTVNDLEITANLSGAEYQWIDCDTAVVILGANEQSFIPSYSGNFSVFITLDDCSVTSECNFIDLVNTEDAWFKDQLSILPNPTSGDFRLNFGDLENINVRIVDLTGRVIEAKQNLSGGSEDLRIDGPAGVYFVEVELKGERTWMKVVVL